MMCQRPKHCDVLSLCRRGCCGLGVVVVCGVTTRVLAMRVPLWGVDKLPHEVERHVGGLNAEWLLAAELILGSPGNASAHPSLSAGSLTHLAPPTHCSA